ncbi:MAG: hypothetical protein KF687_18140 [Cyclobacteriaceae bacterium]|nr:hypothetical protein [Cyclobacteriaceae bacterium]
MAQEQPKEKKPVTKKAIDQGLRWIVSTPEDTIVNERSTDPFIEFSGRIIRNIYIENIGFEKSIYDSTKKVSAMVTKLSNTLHVDTRASTLRKHLFVEENKPLNPYKLADNERFLRDTDFILDSRIIIIPVDGTDSVDITVVTRDVFSIGAQVGGSFPTRPKFTIYDANLDGRAQRLEFTTLIDQNRSPTAGYSLFYRKSSIFGSLANLSLGYTQINTGRSIGEESEHALIGRLDRPLVSPYSRLAGGLEVSRNWSENVYRAPDSLFRSYQYSILDGWVGYNFGVNKVLTNRSRTFLAFRYFDGAYQDQPEQQEFREERIYNNGRAYLSEFTYYRQDFYRTRYVFGFGRTEDVPYGISVGVTGGYVTQLLTGRPYLGIRFNYSKASPKGNFYRLVTNTGVYYRNNKFEDAAIQLGALYATRVLNIGSFKMRNYFSATYTEIFNHRVIDWLYLDRNTIPGFRRDDLEANNRLAIQAQTVLFSPWTFIGFRLAPFAGINWVYLQCLTCDGRFKDFSGLSLGLRARNENLIFGTFELKATYIPTNAEGVSDFVVSFRQNIRIKSTASFVKAPSLVLYN